jgi:hypothetical protein
LTSVVVSISAHSEVGIIVESLDSNPTVDTASVWTVTQVSVPGQAGGPNVLSSSLARTISLPPFDGTLDLSGPDTYAESFSETKLAVDAIPTSAFGLYSGPGSLTLLVNSTGHGSYSGSGDYVFGADAATSVAVSVTYTWSDPAPKCGGHDEDDDREGQRGGPRKPPGRPGRDRH